MRKVSKVSMDHKRFKKKTNKQKTTQDHSIAVNTHQDQHRWIQEQQLSNSVENKKECLT